MAALTVDAARTRILAGAVALAAEPVAIELALGRVLAHGLAAKLTQPPFTASAMAMTPAILPLMAT